MATIEFYFLAYIVVKFSENSEKARRASKEGRTTYIIYVSYKNQK